MSYDIYYTYISIIYVFLQYYNLHKIREQFADTDIGYRLKYEFGSIVNRILIFRVTKNFIGYIIIFIYNMKKKNIKKKDIYFFFIVNVNSKAAVYDFCKMNIHSKYCIPLLFF